MNELVAVRVNDNDGSVTGPLEAWWPDAEAWNRAVPVKFAADWQGKHEDEARQTEVRVLWSLHALLVRFVCKYREILTFSDADKDGYRYRLWERDVAEVFVQPDQFGSRNYAEFEVAPNGMWIDLQIFPGGHSRLQSGLHRRARVHPEARVWQAELSIPIPAITAKFDPTVPWRVNFFRCEGVDPARWYSAWSATKTPQPNFHVPEAFGVLRFE